MTRYVEIRASLITYYKKVDCYSCKHRRETKNFPECLKGCQYECCTHDHSDWEFGGSPWEYSLGIIEGE